MKATKTLLIASFAVLAFSSCKKTDDNNNNSQAETDITVQASKDQAFTENLVQDANDIMDQAMSENANLTGARVFDNSPATSNLVCATVTVTPQMGFPKTVVIDFGAGCTSPNGITRSGIINIVISDSLRRHGSTAIMTFNNYYVQGFKKEGTITWTNTTVPPLRSWERSVVNGKITAPGGVRYWLHAGVKNITQTEGNATPRNPLDDEFTITGNSTVTNMNNVTRTATILTALHKVFICPHFDAGTVQFQGPNHTALLDYGTGTCDNLATIAVNGGTPQTITLP